jgi:hypothetical protein
MVAWLVPLAVVMAVTSLTGSCVRPCGKPVLPVDFSTWPRPIELVDQDLVVIVGVHHVLAAVGPVWAFQGSPLPRLYHSPQPKRRVQTARLRAAGTKVGLDAPKREAAFAAWGQTYGPAPPVNIGWLHSGSWLAAIHLVLALPPTFAQARTCGVLRARCASLVPAGPV